MSAASGNDGPGIPPMPPFQCTGLTSIMEKSQPAPDKRFVGIYYQEMDGTIQRLLESFDLDTGNKFTLVPPPVTLKLGTPLAAIAGEVAEATQIYAVTDKNAIIEAFSTDLVVQHALEDTKLAAITDNSITRIYYQPKDKENVIAQIELGLRQEKIIVSDAIKGTNIGALETVDKVSFLNFDRCLAYHGQDSNLYFWWIDDQSGPQKEEIPVGSLLSNSAVAVSRAIDKIVVYYQDENSELHYIVKSDNFGFNWGEPQKVEAVPEKPRTGTALTAIASEDKREILLSYQDIRTHIHTIHHRL